MTGNEIEGQFEGTFITSLKLLILTLVKAAQNSVGEAGGLNKPSNLQGVTKNRYLHCGFVWQSR